MSPGNEALLRGGDLSLRLRFGGNATAASFAPHRPLGGCRWSYAFHAYLDQRHSRLVHKSGHDTVDRTSGSQGQRSPEIFGSGIAVLKLSQIAIDSAAKHIRTHVSLYHPENCGRFVIGTRIKELVDLVRSIGFGANR